MIRMEVCLENWTKMVEDVNSGCARSCDDMYVFCAFGQILLRNASIKIY